MKADTTSTVILIICLSTSLIVARPKNQPARSWCLDSNGHRRRLYEKWLNVQEQKVCECIYPESLSFDWDGTYPSDASLHCQVNGCINLLTGNYLREGNSYIDARGSICTCLRGPDPYLADYVTAFHLDCTLALQDGATNREAQVWNIAAHTQGQEQQNQQHSDIDRDNLTHQ